MLLYQFFVRCNLLQATLPYVTNRAVYIHPLYDVMQRFFKIPARLPAKPHVGFGTVQLEIVGLMGMIAAINHISRFIAP